MTVNRAAFSDRRRTQKSRMIIALNFRIVLLFVHFFFHRSDSRYIRRERCDRPLPIVLPSHHHDVVYTYMHVCI